MDVMNYWWRHRNGEELGDGEDQRELLVLSTAVYKD